MEMVLLGAQAMKRSNQSSSFSAPLPSTLRCRLIGLGAVLGAERHVFAQQQCHRDLGLQLELVALRTAETEQAVLIRLGGAQRAVDEQALRQKELGRADIHIDAVLLGAERAEQRRPERAGVRAFVLQAERDLRHQRVAVEHGVAGDARFHPDDVLLQLQAAEAQRRQVVLGVELLSRQRDFDALVPAERRAVGQQRVVLRLQRSDMRRAADLAACRMAAGHGPRRQAAAGRAVDAGHPAGQQQLAVCGVRASCAEGQRQGCLGCPANGAVMPAGHGRSPKFKGARAATQPVAP